VPVVILTFPTEHLAVTAGFFYSRQPAETVEQWFLEHRGEPIFSTDLSNGESVWVATWEAPFELHLAEDGVEVLALDLTIGANKRGLRAISWNKPNDREPLRVTEIGNVSWTS
jgi:hypothetical protein